MSYCLLNQVGVLEDSPKRWNQLEQGVCLYYVAISIQAAKAFTFLNETSHPAESRATIHNAAIWARIGWSKTHTVHVICSGIICTPWSRAGKGKKWEDPKCDMYFELFEMIEFFRPWLFPSECTEPWGNSSPLHGSFLYGL